MNKKIFCISLSLVLLLSIFAFPNAVADTTGNLGTVSTKSISLMPYSTVYKCIKIKVKHSSSKEQLDISNFKVKFGSSYLKVTDAYYDICTQVGDFQYIADHYDVLNFTIRTTKSCNTTAKVYQKTNGTFEKIGTVKVHVSTIKNVTNSVKKSVTVYKNVITRINTLNKSITFANSYYGDNIYEFKYKVLDSKYLYQPNENDVECLNAGRVGFCGKKTGTTYIKEYLYQYNNRSHDKVVKKIYLGKIKVTVKTSKSSLSVKSLTMKSAPNMPKSAQSYTIEKRRPDLVPVLMSNVGSYEKGLIINYNKKSTYSMKSSDTSVVKVTGTNNLLALKKGTAKVNVYEKYAGASKKIKVGTIIVNVIGTICNARTISCYIREMRFSDSDGKYQEYCNTLNFMHSNDNPIQVGETFNMEETLSAMLSKFNLSLNDCQSVTYGSEDSSKVSVSKDGIATVKSADLGDVYCLVKFKDGSIFKGYYSFFEFYF